MKRIVRSGLVASLLGVGLGGCMSDASDEPGLVVGGAASDKGGTSENGMAALNGHMPTNGFRRFNGAAPYNSYHAFNGYTGYNGYLPYNGNAALNGNAAFNSASPLNGHPIFNGAPSYNGGPAMNSAPPTNGAPTFNGRYTYNGLNSSESLLTVLNGFEGGANNAQYVVKCALSPNQSVRVRATDKNPAATFQGELGLCPEWYDSDISNNLGCQQKVSSCMEALTNYHGFSVQVEIRAPMPSIGTDSTHSGFDLQEGRYFGNFFGPEPRTWFCVNREHYVGGQQVDYMPVPRMCRYVNQNGLDVMEDCAYHMAGICEDICDGWSCTYRGVTYDYPIEVWRKDVPETALVYRDYALNYGGLPVVPDECADHPVVQHFHGEASTCGDYANRPCENILAEIEDATPILEWEVKTRCPRTCRMSSNCQVNYEAEFLTGLHKVELEDGGKGWSTAGFMAPQDNRGSYIEWDNIIVAATSRYDIAVRYAADDSQRSLKLLVNGSERADSGSLRRTGGWAGEGNWKTFVFSDVNLTEGQNTLRLYSPGLGPNVDRMTISPRDFAPVGVGLLVFDQDVSGTSGSESYSFEVTSDVRSLSVNLSNGRGDASANPRLAVTGPGGARAVCADAGAGVSEVCSISQPAAGNWTVKVDYAGGSGAAWDLQARVWGDEKVLNGGFEDGVEHWSDLTSYHSISTELSYDGTQSLKLHSSSTLDKPSDDAYQVVPMEPNTDYTFHVCMAGLPGLRGKALVRLDDEFTGIGCTMNMHESRADGTWHCKTCSVNSGSHTSMKIRMTWSDQGDQDFRGTAYADGISFTKGKSTLTTGANLVANPSFESSDTGWDNLNGYWSVSTESSSDGIQSARLHSDAPVDPANLRQKVALDKNTDYALSYCMRSLPGQSGNVYVDTHDDFDDEGCDQKMDADRADGNWHCTACEFNSGSLDQLTLRALVSASAPFKGTLYVDAFELTNLDASPPTEAPTDGPTAGPGEPHLVVEPSFAPGESITVGYENLPSGNQHWIATYEAGTSHSSYLDWKFTSGSPSGTLTLPGLSAGSYEVRLFFDDSYTLEKSVPITVGGTSSSSGGLGAACSSDSACASGNCHEEGSTDRCRPSSCSSSWDVNDGEFCELYNCGPCAQGEGDCDRDNQCQEGLECSEEGSVDICRQREGFDAGSGGLGDACSSDSACASGNCHEEGSTDRCRPSSCSSSWDVNDGEFCELYNCGPCAKDEGDCDGDSQCLGSLECIEDGKVDYCG